MPDGLPDRFGLWQSFSGRSGFSKSNRRCQLRCSRRQGVLIRIHTGVRTPVAKLQVGAQSKCLQFIALEESFRTPVAFAKTDWTWSHRTTR